MNQLYVKHKNFQEALYTMADTDFDTKQQDCVEYLEVIRDILWNKMTEVRA